VEILGDGRLIGHGEDVFAGDAHGVTVTYKRKNNLN